LLSRNFRCYNLSKIQAIRGFIYKVLTIFHIFYCINIYHPKMAFPVNHSSIFSIAFSATMAYGAIFYSIFLFAPFLLTNALVMFLIDYIFKKSLSH
jgi:hypothetical protein